MQIQIRKAHLDEVAALVRLFSAAVHDGAAAHYDPRQRVAWAPQPPDLARWRERFAGLDTWVAEGEDGLAGFIAYDWDGHIDLLFTHPDQLRRGVATALYRFAEATLMAAGVMELTTAASLVAHPFFTKQGFELVEEQTVWRGEVALRRFAMRKALVAGR